MHSTARLGSMAASTDAPGQASGFVKAAVESVHARAPLVHCVTNFVSMDLAANAVLAAHASPAMVHAPEEASGFARIAGCVVVNVGTIDPLWADGMIAAVRAVREQLQQQCRGATHAQAKRMTLVSPPLPRSPTRLGRTGNRSEGSCRA